MPKYQNKPSAIQYLKEDAGIYAARVDGEIPKPRHYFKLIDLFCGAGGMTLGFTQALGHQFKPIWANDYNKYCVETYNANFGNCCACGDIIECASR
jgi:DNA (cytosine-5)-methyltransferase 1